MEQIHKLCQIVQEFEINSVKITGGEPLLHPQIVDIIRCFRQIPTVRDISLVTNGLLLEGMVEDLKSAGLDRLNIGCDSIEDERFKTIKNIEGALEKVKNVGFKAVKLNMVILKDVNQDEIATMIETCRKHDIILQLIELINSNDDFYKKYHVNLDDVETELGKRAIKVVTRSLHHRKQYHLEEGVIVEVVKPVHNSDFCANCHTLRVTSDFSFLPCLNRSDLQIPINDDVKESLRAAMKNRIPFCR